MPEYPFNDWSKLPYDLEKWADSIMDQTARKFGVDADGDCPVKVWVIDRTKYEPVHYWPVPYLHDAKTPEQIEEIERALLINLDTAISQYQRFRAARQRQSESDSAARMFS